VRRPWRTCTFGLMKSSKFPCIKDRPVPPARPAIRDRKALQVRLVVTAPRAIPDRPARPARSAQPAKMAMLARWVRLAPLAPPVLLAPQVKTATLARWARLVPLAPPARMGMRAK
jgi:hypothetical protein